MAIPMHVIEDGWKNNSDIVDLTLEAVDEGRIDPETLIMSCLKYMAPDDVVDMLKQNELYHMVGNQDQGL